METRLSRWSNKKKMRDGKPEPFVFTEDDLEICKLLSPPSRDPRGYRFLPTSYIALLLDRSYEVIRRRTKKLRAHSYLELPEQPHNNFRELIQSIGKAAYTQLEEAGAPQDPYKARKLAHELMACLIAASFELATHNNTTIEVLQFTRDLPVRPDWPIFEFTTAHHSRFVFIEADTASEGLKVNDPNATDIHGKFEEYLKLIHTKKIRNAMILFATTKPVRMNSMIELLKYTIDAHDYDHEYADYFGFTVMPYDRFLNKLPKPTAWAATQNWQRAGHTPFNFSKKG